MPGYTEEYTYTVCVNVTSSEAPSTMGLFYLWPLETIERATDTVINSLTCEYSD